MLKKNDISFARCSPKEAEFVENLILNTNFVIPSINGGKLLERMLPTLRLPPRCVVVLDQGSTDSTNETCKNFDAEIIQLNVPHTYTQSCNIAIQIAKNRGSEYVFISNNDITFVTDVARELMYEMSKDDNLGIVSCSQIILQNESDLGILSNRVYWDLERTDFEHDLNNPEPNVYRRESDFCELTCALLRVSAVSSVGGFDDEFGFYHEDADLGFRLRQAGYSCAYLPQSQIRHFAGSTFSQGQSERRLRYIEKSRQLFTRKHLGYGLKYIDHRNDVATSWNVVNKNLYPYMKRFGLIDSDRPELLFAHPGIEPFDCLYSVWETSKLPNDWLKYNSRYRATYLPSRWNEHVFREEGFNNVHYVPLGVETDTFHPWGFSNRQYDCPTFLWFARNQFRKGFDIMIEAWKAFQAIYPDTKLIVMGHGILEPGDMARLKPRRWQNWLIHDDDENHISYRETVVPLTSSALAELYRGVDYLVLTSRSEGFGFSVVEAMACGVVSIFPDYGATKDMRYEGSINFGGTLIAANYADKDFADVGSWWEPAPESVLDAMVRAFNMDDQSRKTHLRRGYNKVANNFTWRDTCFSIRQDLMSWQEQKQIKYKFQIGNVVEEKISLESYCLKLEEAHNKNIKVLDKRTKD